MSDIRERAKGYIETLRNSKSAYIIAGLLAELERVENDTAKVKLAYAEGKITGRQQAARECIEIIDNVDDDALTNQWGNYEEETIKNAIGSVIKAHFGLDG